MQLEIKTKSGRVYKRVAWMGGDSAPLNVAETYEDWACLYSFFYREQMVDYIYFWNEWPREDAEEIFRGRARGDAWATLRETF